MHRWAPAKSIVHLPTGSTQSSLTVAFSRLIQLLFLWKGFLFVHRVFYTAFGLVEVWRMRLTHKGSNKSTHIEMLLPESMGRLLLLLFLFSLLMWFPPERRSSRVHRRKESTRKTCVEQRPHKTWNSLSLEYSIFFCRTSYYVILRYYSR